MADEMSSFVKKFNQLKRDGKKAFLWLECQAGHSFVTLQVHLGKEEVRGPHFRRHTQAGYHEDPQHHPRHFQENSHHRQEDVRLKKATPSRIRRRHRREQARALAEISAVNTAGSESAAEQAAQTIPPLLSQPVMEEEALVAEQASELVADAIDPLPPVLPVEQPGQYPHPSVPKLPPHLPAELAGHHPHPSRHLLPLQPVDQILKSFSFQVPSLQPSLPSITSPHRRARRMMAPRPKPGDPFVIRKPVKYLRTLQNQNIERAVWLSTPLLKRVAASVGGSWCGGGWVESVGLFVRFVDCGLGLHTEPSIVIVYLPTSEATKHDQSNGKQNIYSITVH